MSHLTFRRPTGSRAVTLGALAAAASLVLAACGAAQSTDRAGDGEAATGGSLNFAIGTDPISINPGGAGSGNDARYVTRQLVDSLLDQDPQTGEIVPWLATEWEVSADATEFTFELQEGVTFSDGSDFNADSVVATFADIIDNGALVGNTLSFFNHYEGSEVVNDHELIVRFSEPNAPFLQALTEPPLAPLAQATLDLPFEQRDTDGVIGTGPFVLESYTPNDSILLSKREGYDWASPLSDHDGEAWLDEVIFTVAPEASVRTGSLQSGAVDVIGSVAPNDQDTLEQAGFELIVRANPGNTFGLTPYNAKPVLAEAAVRQALSAAIDRQALVAAVLNERYAVARSVLADTTPGFVDVSEHFAYDPDRARELLQEAGWQEGTDGIREKDGERLALVLGWQTNNVTNQAVVELIQQQVREVGIDIELISGTVPETTEREEAGTLDLRFGNFSRSDGDVLRTSFSSATLAPNREADPEVDRLVTEQLGIIDTEERNDVLAQAQERIVSAGLHIPVHQLTTVLGTTDSVHGVELGADSRLRSLVSATIED